MQKKSFLEIKASKYPKYWAFGKKKSIFVLFFSLFYVTWLNCLNNNNNQNDELHHMWCCAVTHLGPGGSAGGSLCNYIMQDGCCGGGAPNVSQTCSPSLSVLQRLINKSISAAPQRLAIFCCHHRLVPPLIFPQLQALSVFLPLALSFFLSHTCTLRMEIKLRVSNVDAAYLIVYEGKDLLTLTPWRRQATKCSCRGSERMTRPSVSLLMRQWRGRQDEGERRGKSVTQNKQHIRLKLCDLVVGGGRDAILNKTKNTFQLHFKAL